MHPIDVAAQGIDFAVVRDVAIGMAAVPTRKGIRAETRMHEREGTFHRGMPQVGIIQVDLLGHEHALVDECLIREARNVEPFVRILAVPNRLFRTLADDVELAFEGHVVGELRIAADENLAHERLGGLGRSAQ